MITTIIFDFGDIFINLEKQRCASQFEELGISLSNQAILSQNDLYEKGEISEEEFLNTFLKIKPNLNLIDLKKAWNSVLGNFPLYRLEFLQMLAQKYQLFLLTNTDPTHIAHFEEMVGASFFTDFYNCFEKVFYSFEMKMRKPDPRIYTAILNKYDLAAKRVLFVDDKKENTDSAASLGISVWNLQVGQEDVVDLLENKNLPL
jgi:HAD superfamily hydrolase (TIGR01509 family)